MASETLRAILTAVWSGGQATAKAAADIERVGGVSERTKSRVQALGEGLGTASRIAGVAAGGIATAWKVIGEGAELELASSRFDNLTESIGSTADVMLTRLREATGGMISDANLIASASQIISLGLMDTEDGVVRLARVVGELGWDMNQVILTFANNSKLRLDALGLSISDVDERTQEFIDSGYEMDQAFDLAVLEAGEARVKLLGSSMGTTSGDMRVLEADIQNIKNAMLEWIAVQSGPAIHQMAGGYASDLQGMVDAQMSTVESTEDLIAIGQRLSGITYFEQWLTGTLHNVEASEEGVVEGLARMAGSAEEFQNLLLEAFGDDLIVSLDLRATDLGHVTEIFNEVNAAAEESAIATYELRRAGLDAGAAFEGPVASAFDAAMAAVDDYTESAGYAAQETYEMRREGIDSSEALREKIVSDYEEQVAAAEEAEEAAREVARAYAEDFSDALNTSDEEAENFKLTLFDQAVQMGVNKEALELLAIATGEYTDEQIEAALKTAAMREKVMELAGEISDGTITVGDAILELERFEITLGRDYIINVDSETAMHAEQAARMAKQAVEALDGSTANITVTTHFMQQGTPYSGPYDTYAPDYQSGTDGWQTVPGGAGEPFPVILHGGEQFAVVPEGGGATNSTQMEGAGSEQNVVNNFYGTSPDEVIRALQDRGYLPRTTLS